ncbi:MAG: hypothetical protein ACM3PY_14055 [Omnitrophica WOR_2 bacterium]
MADKFISPAHRAGTRLERSRIGRSGEEELKSVLRRYGFIVLTTGQENWLAKSVHDRIRPNHEDPMVQAIRYMPDFLAYHPQLDLRFFAYWDAKVNVTPGTLNFTIEKACYEEAIARTRKGERVVIAFKEVDGRWFANWAEQLAVVADMSRQRRRAKGAKTPYLLISKASTHPLAQFINL